MSQFEVVVFPGRVIGGSPSVDVVFRSPSRLPHIPEAHPFDLLQPQQLTIKTADELAKSQLPSQILALLPALVEADANKIVASTGRIGIGFWPPHVQRQLSRADMDAENVATVIRILGGSPDFRIVH